jgi:hypothetical protein
MPIAIAFCSTIQSQFPPHSIEIRAAGGLPEIIPV